jgi:hypothetical protein
MFGSVAIAAGLALSGCAATATSSSPGGRAASYDRSASAVKTNASPGLAASRIAEYLSRRSFDPRASRPGVWRLSIDGVVVLVMAEDERVRILAPIFALKQLGPDASLMHAIMIRLLQSNFERAADARYALFDGIVFATVTHPAPTLHDRDLDLFLGQVVNLHKNTFRIGLGAYSADPPDPGSVEIDPRLDDSLLSPESFERDRMHAPSAKPEPRAPDDEDDEEVPTSQRVYL